MIFDLQGKVAVVTGSSRGIGRAIAEGLAKAGANVVVSSRKQSACDEVSSHINRQTGDQRSIAVAANISAIGDLHELVQTTCRHFGQIDILICNAASNTHFGPLAELTDEAFRKVIDNNVLSALRLVGMVAPDMVSRKRGSIILVSSIGAMAGSTTIGAYNISKAANSALVRNLAAEYGPSNVRVNAIAPGLVRTDFSQALWEDPVTLRRLTDPVPLRRIGAPEDLAGAAVFLASDGSSFVTGTTLIVDGGATISFGL